MGSALTLVFTDIEGSTRLLQRLGSLYPAVLQEHEQELRSTFEARGGRIVATHGDGIFAVFDRSEDAVSAVVGAQVALASKDWPEGEQIRVRMGVHTGEPTAVGTDFVGIDVHRAARIADAGHGGQILVSRATRDTAGEGLEFLDLGEHRLKDLAEAEWLFQLVAPGLPTDFPPLKSLSNTNLPAPPWPLVDRVGELEQIRSRVLAGARLLTLTGPGGTGKTRLALEGASELVGGFPNGVFLVDLSPIADPALVLPTVMKVLGVREDAERPLAESLAEALRGKRTLLLLDNLEQVLEAAPEVGELLAKAPGLQAIATSRERLNLSAEQELAVPPLPVPDAVELFVERARVARGGFDPAPEDQAAIEEICARVDGLPLAVELAAARARILSPRSLLERLSRRLDVLAGGPSDAPERQRALRATLDWSHELLSETEQDLFARLAVFVGGWTVEAAEAVSAGDLDGLCSLADKSLVRQTNGTDGEPRFWMLETIREYASEQLSVRGESLEFAHRHAEHFAELGRQAVRELRGPEAARWLLKLEQELDNVRAALAFALQAEEVDLGLELTTHLYRFWLAHGHASEGRRWFDEFLPHVHASSPAIAGDALHRAGDMALWQGDHERAAELSERADALLRGAGLTEKLCYTLTTKGWAIGALGDFDRAVAVLEEALELARREGFEMAASSALNNLAAVHKLQGDYVRAMEFNEECLEIIERSGDPLNVAVMLGNVGEAALGVGDHARATEVLERSLELARELGDSRQAEWSLAHLALASLLQGDTQRGRELFAESLPQALAAHDLRSLDACLHGLAGVAAARGDAERAAQLWGAGERLRESLGSQPGPPQLALESRYLSDARAALGDRFGPLEAAGRDLSLEDAVALGAAE